MFELFRESISGRPHFWMCSSRTFQQLSYLIILFEDTETSCFPCSAFNSNFFEYYSEGVGKGSRTLSGLMLFFFSSSPLPKNTKERKSSFIFNCGWWSGVFFSTSSSPLPWFTFQRVFFLVRRLHVIKLINSDNFWKGLIRISCFMLKRKLLQFVNIP